MLGVLVLIILPLWFWFFCRIEPGADEIAVLIHKTGKDLPSGQILALEKNQKGIQLEVLPEGRYFKNPYHWDWRIKKITDIPPGRLGVLTRLYGKELEGGQILAPEGYKGIVPDVLGPGKYRINPYAYSVQFFDAITIRPGFGGVKTALTGADVLTGAFWQLGESREDARADRADQLEDSRADRANRLEDARADRADQLEEARAERAQQQDGRRPGMMLHGVSENH